MGKTVFIAGASSGIGFALAKEFISRGYTVFAGSRNVSKMEPLAVLGAKTFACDITSQESITKVRDAIQESTGGKLDILYLNAGVAGPGTLFNTPIEETKSVFETNVFGSIMVLQAFHRMLLKSQGTVAFTGSTVSLFNMPYQFNYTASKSTFDMLARQLVLDAGKLGIKTVLVRSGAVQSEIFQPAYRPPAGSVYDLGNQEPLASKKLDPKKMVAADYAKQVISEIEKAIRGKKMYTEIYKGTGAKFTWWVSKLGFPWPYMPVVFAILKLNEPIQKIKENLTATGVIGE